MNVFFLPIGERLIFNIDTLKMIKCKQQILGSHKNIIVFVSLSSFKEIWESGLFRKKWLFTNGMRNDANTRKKINGFNIN